MKNYTLVFLILLICTSCIYHKGERMDGVCRPKSPNFELVDMPFVGTNKIQYYKVYLIDDVTMARGFGFYPDGRLIYFHSNDGYALSENDLIEKTWDNASAIGYWRLNQNSLLIEYFSCTNSGDYITHEGIVKDNDVFLKRLCSTSPFKTEYCYEKLILTTIKFN